MDFNQKIATVREEMKKENIDLLMVTTEDAYLAESAVDYWRSLRWLTGFTGTLAYAMVTQDRVAFWTDFRYIRQATHQVQIDGVELYDVTQYGAEHYLGWISQVLQDMEGAEVVFAVDGRTITASRGQVIEKQLAAVSGKQVRLVCTLDIFDRAWTDRPEPAYKPIFEHELKYAGKTRPEKAAEVRAALAARGADHYIVGTMEGVVWLTNMRGRDLVNPLFASHALVTPEVVKLFCKVEMIPAPLQEKLKADGYQLFDINQASEQISQIPAEATVYVDPSRTNFALMAAIPAACGKVIDFDIVNNLKAIKNPVEIKNFRETNKLECVALARFIKHLKEEAAHKDYNEYDLTQVLEDFRRRSPEYLCSADVPLLAGYMANGALPHYHPTPQRAAKVLPSGAIVVDAMAHYYGGTTDITRTIYLGPCPEYDEQLRKDYTLTLRSMMALSRQSFRKGADGAYLDSVARCVLWNHHLHYSYGTGHGIGFCIVCHEGPQFIAEPSYKKEWAFCYLPIVPGMVMANEPGVYKEGRYGIRIEDNLLVVEDAVTEFGEFYRFENFSYCPLERELIDPDQLYDDELAWVNDYQQTVFKTLSPYMDEEEVRWLEKETAPLKKTK